MKYLIANWKAQMILAETTQWLNVFYRLISADEILKKKLKNELSLVICPPAPFIVYVGDHLNNVNIKVGSQNISSMNRGKFTGEITAEALKDICDYAIIGHSERRSEFNESEETIALKLTQASQHGLKTIHCVRNYSDKRYDLADMVAYEPVEAIGTGANADINTIVQMKSKLNISHQTPFLYGGSVDSKNISHYLDTDKIDGFLVGTASLDPQEFYLMATKMI